MLKINQIALWLIFICFISLAPTLVWSHPGRTSSDGCHYCRTNCGSWGVPWNERHCHGGNSSTSQSTTVSEPSPQQAQDTPVSSGQPSVKPPPVKDESQYLFNVQRVVDGDTVEILYFNNEIKVIRLIGIDTPETVDPRKPVQCFGKEASQKTKNLIDGKKVRIEKDSIGDTIDKYGRLLRYVYLDNSLVNAELIEQGFAYAYTAYPFSKSSDFKKLEARAKSQLRGLWSPETCAVKDNESEKLSASYYILEQKGTYEKNHRGFREKLISEMTKKFHSKQQNIGGLVYKLLPD